MSQHSTHDRLANSIANRVDDDLDFVAGIADHGETDDHHHEKPANREAYTVPCMVTDDHREKEVHLRRLSGCGSGSAKEGGRAERAGCKGCDWSETGERAGRRNIPVTRVA